MKPQPQPPERRPLHRADDPASVLRDAEIPYGFDRDSAMSATTRRFLDGLASSGIPHLLVGALAMLQHIDGRTTRDINLIVALDDLEKIPGFLLEERNEWFATGTVKLFALPSLYRQGNIQRAALYESDILQLLLHQPTPCETLLAQLQAHMPPSDINALRQILTEIQHRLTNQHRF